MIVIVPPGVQARDATASLHKKAYIVLTTQVFLMRINCALCNGTLDLKNSRYCPSCEKSIIERNSNSNEIVEPLKKPGISLSGSTRLQENSRLQSQTRKVSVLSFLSEL